MTQDEFRAAMNDTKRAGQLLWVTNGYISGIALGYDSGTNEAVLHKDIRVPLDGLIVEVPELLARGALSPDVSREIDGEPRG